MLISYKNFVVDQENNFYLISLSTSTPCFLNVIWIFYGEVKCWGTLARLLRVILNGQEFYTRKSHKTILGLGTSSFRNSGYLLQNEKQSIKLNHSFNIVDVITVILVTMIET